MKKTMPLLFMLLYLFVVLNGCTGESANTHPGESEFNEENEEFPVKEIVFIDEFNGNIISPFAAEEMRDKLLDSIAGMHEMGPGVGPWKIIYCNKEKIILYNYAHVVACDISQENKGIYSIIDLRGLKTGSYQGSTIAMAYPSSDAMFCIVGAGYGEMDIEASPGLYLCNFYDGSVKELETNCNMANGEVKWYKKTGGSGSLPRYVLISLNDTGIIWDVEGGKRIDSIPPDARLETIEENYMEQINIETGYTYLNWWKVNENIVIGAPYKKGTGSAIDLKLTDFEIIEVNLKDMSVKILYKIAG